MGSLNIDRLETNDGYVKVLGRELTNRVIQLYRQDWRDGEWNPNTDWNWLPGGYADFTPKRADSRLRYKLRLPMAWVSASHAIAHYEFYANNVLFASFGTSGTHSENAGTYDFEVPSWGTFNSRIGLKTRSYSENSNEFRYYTTYYWNGTGRSAQVANGTLWIEEIIQ